MGRLAKVVVCGMKGVGKTAILEQVVYGNIAPDNINKLQPTIEDIYVANIESDRGIREKVRFYDTAGIDKSQTSNSFGSLNQQLPRHFLALADGYILVYDIGKLDSLEVLYSLKRDIDKNKDKKEICLIVVGNRGAVDSVSNETLARAQEWCKQEKIRHFVVSALERASLYEPFIYIASRLNPPPSKSSFPPIIARKNIARDNN